MNFLFLVSECKEIYQKFYWNCYMKRMYRNFRGNLELSHFFMANSKFLRTILWPEKMWLNGKIPRTRQNLKWLDPLLSILYRNQIHDSHDDLTIFLLNVLNSTKINSELHVYNIVNSLSYLYRKNSFPFSVLCQKTL